MSTQEINRQIAQWAFNAFQPTGKSVSRVQDSDNVNYVDILVGLNSPVQNCNSYATVNLSDHQIFRKGRSLPFRAEFLGVCDNRYSEYINILATASFCAFKSRWEVGPGVIYPDIVRMYNANWAVKHIILADPFLWGDSFLSRSIGDRTIAWLMAVPITEYECQYAEKFGSDKLLSVLEKNKVDFANMERESSVGIKNN